MSKGCFLLKNQENKVSPCSTLPQPKTQIRGEKYKAQVKLQGKCLR